MALQFGVNLFPQQWEDTVRIEEMVYDSAWTSEHIFFYFPTFDALTMVAPPRGPCVRHCPDASPAAHRRGVGERRAEPPRRRRRGRPAFSQPSQASLRGAATTAKARPPNAAHLARRYNQPFEKIVVRY